MKHFIEFIDYIISPHTNVECFVCDLNRMPKETYQDERHGAVSEYVHAMHTFVYHIHLNYF